MPYMVMAADETTTLDVGNVDPVLGAVSLTDSGDSSATTVAPEATYKVKFSVTDTNTLDDLTDIEVEIYYETQAADALRRAYTFTWTEGAGDTDFVSSPAGYVVATSVTPTAAEELGSSFNFELHFKLDGVAVPSGAATAWNIDVTVTDDSAAPDSDVTTTFDANKYQSLSVNTSSIAFGSVNPGAALTKQGVMVTFTANTELDVDVLGANLVSGSESIAIGEFDAWDESETTPAATVLTASAQAIYSAYAATADSINSGVAGYTDNGSRELGFDGDVPSPQQDGAYTATWTITLDQSAVTPA